MNRRQIKALWFGIISAVLILLFPPWHVAEVPLPPSFLHSVMNPPQTLWYKDVELDEIAQIDWMRLGILLSVVALITGGLLLSLRDGQDRTTNR